MKWLLLLLFLALPVPLANWMRAKRLNFRIGAFAFGVIPFFIAQFHLLTAPYSWAMWPGYVKGIELTGMDVVAAAILIATARDRTNWRSIVPVLPYFVASCLSVALAETPQAPIFYCWQLVRIIVTFLAVSKLVVRLGSANEILLGLNIGTIYEAYVAIGQFLHGDTQSAGTFGHQNLLGMVTHFELYPTLALILGRKCHPIYYLGLVSGLIVIVLTASRATIGLAGFGLALTLLLSCWMRWTPRKGAILAGAVTVALLFTPVALISLGRRSAEQKKGSSEERGQFENAARFMIADHPFGVGANEYVIMANTRGYSDRAGVSWQSSERGAHVHNSYLLTAAELGWFGLVTFGALLTINIIFMMRSMARYRRSTIAMLMPGLAAAIISISMQAYFEWVFLTFNVEYVYALAIGMAVGLTELAKFERKRGVRHAYDTSGRQPPSHVQVSTASETMS